MKSSTLRPLGLTAFTVVDGALGSITALTESILNSAGSWVSALERV